MNDKMKKATESTQGIDGASVESDRLFEDRKQSDLLASNTVRKSAYTSSQLPLGYFKGTLMDLANTNGEQLAN